MSFGPGGWELRIVGQNRTEIRTRRGLVCFSYSTPVVVYADGTKELFLTSEFISKTTSRHIAHWHVETYASKQAIKQDEMDVIARYVLGLERGT